MTKTEEKDARLKMQEYRNQEGELSQEDKNELWEWARTIQRLDNERNETVKTQLEHHGQWLKDVSTDK